MASLFFIGYGREGGAVRGPAWSRHGQAGMAVRKSCKTPTVAANMVAVFDSGPSYMPLLARNLMKDSECVS